LTPYRLNSGDCMYSGMRVLSKSQMQAIIFWVNKGVAIVYALLRL
jgi:hypothetical protein